MTQRYMIRIAAVIAFLSVALALAFWLAAGKTDGEKWRFFRIGQTNPTTFKFADSLKFMRADGAATDIDSIARLPGGLAFLPNKTEPLFGQRSAAADAVVDMVLEPEKCLLVRRIQFIQAPAADGAGGGRILLSVDADSRLVRPSAVLRAALPPQCATTGGPECGIAIWAEARPKKCD